MKDKLESDITINICECESENVVQFNKNNKELDLLIEGIKNRKDESAIELYNKYGELINRMVWRILGIDQDHDDIVNQVFINIIESINKINNYEAFKSWIETITINTIRKELRKRKYRRLLFLNTETQDFENMDGNKTENDLFIHRFYELLDKMNSDEKIIFTLYFVEDRTMEEISSICKVSLSTVKRRIVKAKNRFLNYAKKDSILCSKIEEIINEH